MDATSRLCAKVRRPRGLPQCERWRPQTQTQTKEEALDRRFVFHPFTKLDEHPSSDAPVIVSGQGVDADRHRAAAPTSTRWPASGASTSATAAREIADALRDEALRLGYYHSFSSMATDLPGRARRARARACTRCRCRRSSSATAARTRTTRRSSSSGSTTTCSAAPRRRRSSRATAATTASRSRRPASPASTSLHDGFDLPLPMIRHTTAPHRLWEAEPGETDEEFAQRLADELEQLILAEGPETVAAFIAEPVQGAGGVDRAARGLLGARSRRCCAATTCC